MNKLFSKVAALSVGLAMAIGVGVAVGSRSEKQASVAHADTTTTYSFSSKSWAASPANWTSGKDGGGFSNNGIQVTTSYSGANGTSPKSFTNVTKVVATYNTNKSAGAGSIEIKIGSNDAVSNNVAYTSGDGRSANYTSEFNFSPAQSGSIKVTVNTTTNSIYLVSIAITEASEGPTYYTVSYNTNGGTGNVIDDTQYSLNDKATVLGIGEVTKSGYTFVNWSYGDNTYSAGDKLTVTGNITLTANWYKNDSISVISGKEANSIYTGASLVLSSCVNAVGDGALSFTVPENDYYSYNAENFTLTADSTKTGGPATITATKGTAEPVQFTVSVVERPSTGSFEKYSGEIEEGDYLIVFDNGAMKAQISSNRFTYDSVTPVEDVISEPDPLAIWHIAESGDYWTLYNAEAGKYAGSTSSKNQGALLDEVTNNAKWTVTGSATYEFENLTRSTASSDSGNKWLRRNGTNGFACYASGTGGALSLYKLASVVVKHDVIDSVSNGSLDKSKVIDGATLITKITPDAGYALPESVAVSVAGSPVSFEYEDGYITVPNVEGDVTIEGVCVRINPLLYLYSQSAGAEVDVYGFYVGFLDGTGPVIMDGEYGMVVYDKTADVSSYTEGETILHVTGSISIYKGLYEIGSPTIDAATSVPEDCVPSTPVVYATRGGETADYASRLTTVTGVIAEVVSGSFDDAAGTNDIKMNFTVGSATIQVFYKKAAQLADTDAYADMKAAFTGSTEITVKGFTSWYNGFQIQMNGIIKAVASYTAEDFSADLLAQTDAVCVNYVDGKSSYSEFKAALTAIWSNLASNDKYPSLPSDQKTILAEAERVESGTVVERAMARYDFLTGKYELNNFINGRTPVQAFIGSLAINETTDNNTMIIIITIAAVSAFAFTSLLVIKKKKHN